MGVSVVMDFSVVMGFSLVVGCTSRVRSALRATTARLRRAVAIIITSSKKLKHMLVRPHGVQ